MDLKHWNTTGVCPVHKGYSHGKFCMVCGSAIVDICKSGLCKKCRHWENRGPFRIGYSFEGGNEVIRVYDRDMKPIPGLERILDEEKEQKQARG